MSDSPSSSPGPSAVKRPATSQPESEAEHAEGSSRSVGSSAHPGCKCQGLALDIEAAKAELICNICLELPNKTATVIPCLHSFCWTCIQQWFDSHTKCPRCVQPAQMAKSNATLNNLIEAMQRADPSLMKPADVLAAEQRAIREYQNKTHSNGTIHIAPAHRAEDQDDESEDEDEDDPVPVFWPCPCCEAGNPSGFRCNNPIPLPPQGLLNPDQQRPRRGETWPDLDLASEHLPHDMTDAHESCSACTAWIPRSGVPAAQCQACEVFTCAPYDSQRACPSGNGLFTNLRGYGETGLVDADGFDPRIPVRFLNTIEQQRLKSYLEHTNLTPRQHLEEILTSAQALFEPQSGAQDASNSATAGSGNLADTASDGVPNQDDRGIPAADTDTGTATQQPPPPPDMDHTITYCLTNRGLCQHPLCHPLDRSRAEFILNGYFCVDCAEKILQRSVYCWWHNIRENHKELLTAEVRDLPNCWYGHECRTQWHKPSHAERYNHVCKSLPPDQRVDDSTRSHDANEAVAQS